MEIRFAEADVIFSEWRPWRVGLEEPLGAHMMEGAAGARAEAEDEVVAAWHKRYAILIPRGRHLLLERRDRRRVHRLRVLW